MDSKKLGYTKHLESPNGRKHSKHEFKMVQEKLIPVVDDVLKSEDIKQNFKNKLISRKQYENLMWASEFLKELDEYENSSSISKSKVYNKVNFHASTLNQLEELHKALGSTVAKLKSKNEEKSELKYKKSKIAQLPPAEPLILEKILNTTEVPNISCICGAGYNKSIKKISTHVTDESKKNVYNMIVQNYPKHQHSPICINNVNEGNIFKFRIASNGQLELDDASFHEIRAETNIGNKVKTIRSRSLPNTWLFNFNKCSTTNLLKSNSSSQINLKRIRHSRPNTILAYSLKSQKSGTNEKPTLKKCFSDMKRWFSHKNDRKPTRILKEKAVFANIGHVKYSVDSVCNSKSEEDLNKKILQAKDSRIRRKILKSRKIMLYRSCSCPDNFKFRYFEDVSMTTNVSESSSSSSDTGKDEKKKEELEEDESKLVICIKGVEEEQDIKIVIRQCAECKNVSTKTSDSSKTNSSSLTHILSSLENDSADSSESNRNDNILNGNNAQFCVSTDDGEEFLVSLSIKKKEKTDCQECGTQNNIKRKHRMGIKNQQSFNTGYLLTNFSNNLDNLASSSIDLDVSLLNTRLREKGIEYPNAKILIKLKEIGVNNLLLASRPAKCCRGACLNKKLKKSMPYAASLKSLPLDENDIEKIKQNLKNLQTCKKFKNQQRSFFKIYYLHDIENKEKIRKKLNYYINLVNDLDNETNDPLEYRVMFFEIKKDNVKPKSADNLSMRQENDTCNSDEQKSRSLSEADHCKQVKRFKDVSMENGKNCKAKKPSNNLVSFLHSRKFKQEKSTDSISEEHQTLTNSDAFSGNYTVISKTSTNYNSSNTQTENFCYSPSSNECFTSSEIFAECVLFQNKYFENNKRKVEQPIQFINNNFSKSSLSTEKLNMPIIKRKRKKTEFYLSKSKSDVSLSITSIQSKIGKYPTPKINKRIKEIESKNVCCDLKSSSDDLLRILSKIICKKLTKIVHNKELLQMDENNENCIKEMWAKFLSTEFTNYVGFIDKLLLKSSIRKFKILETKFRKDNFSALIASQPNVEAQMDEYDDEVKEKLNCLETKIIQTEFGKFQKNQSLQTMFEKVASTEINASLSNIGANKVLDNIQKELDYLYAKYRFDKMLKQFDKDMVVIDYITESKSTLNSGDNFQNFSKILYQNMNSNDSFCSSYSGLPQNFSSVILKKALDSSEQFGRNYQTKSCCKNYLVYHNKCSSLLQKALSKSASMFAKCSRNAVTVEYERNKFNGTDSDEDDNLLCQMCGRYVVKNCTSSSLINPTLSKFCSCPRRRETSIKKSNYVSLTSCNIENRCSQNYKTFNQGCIQVMNLEEEKSKSQEKKLKKNKSKDSSKKSKSKTSELEEKKEESSSSTPKDTITEESKYSQLSKKNESQIDEKKDEQLVKESEKEITEDVEKVLCAKKSKTMQTFCSCNPMRKIPCKYCADIITSIKINEKSKNSFREGKQEPSIDKQEKSQKDVKEEKSEKIVLSHEKSIRLEQEEKREKIEKDDPVNNICILPPCAFCSVVCNKVKQIVTSNDEERCNFCHGRVLTNKSYVQNKKSQTKQTPKEEIPKRQVCVKTELERTRSSKHERNKSKESSKSKHSSHRACDLNETKSCVRSNKNEPAKCSHCLESSMTLDIMMDNLLCLCPLINQEQDYEKDHRLIVKQDPECQTLDSEKGKMSCSSSNSEEITYTLTKLTVLPDGTRDIKLMDVKPMANGCFLVPDSNILLFNDKNSIFS